MRSFPQSSSPEQPLAGAYPELQREYGFVTLDVQGDRLRIGVERELSDRALSDLAFATGKRVEQVLVGSGEVGRHQGRAVAGTAPGHAVDSGVEAPALPIPDLASGPVTHQVDRVLRCAVDLGASDIHIEPYERHLRVRYRLDGVLHHAGELDPGQKEAIAARIKVLAGLDVAERRRPQDGRFRLRREGSRTSGQEDVDLRVSVLPTRFGEKVVLRILDRSGLRLHLDVLGFGARDLAAFREAIAAPHGMVFVTGPTGSGKSTTLYAALSAIATTEVNVTTVEDPIEYDIQGVNQTQARPDIGFGFAEALRSFLRQDPDVIMVGEVRDAETAEVAVRAALTGHLVLSTLHTNDAPSTVTRLLDMGVEPYLVAASVRLAVAQRLVRLLCPACKVPLEGEALSRALALFPGLEGRLAGAGGVFSAAGCARCGGTGYRGRAAVFEVMPVSEAIATLVARRATAQEVREQAQAEGMRPLREAALERFLAGETSVEEVVRATGG